MSKEQYLAAHEREVTEYLDRNPNASWSEAYDATADRAFDRMREDMADKIDAYRQRMKDDGL